MKGILRTVCCLTVLVSLTLACVPASAGYYAASDKVIFDPESGLYIDMTVAIALDPWSGNCLDLMNGVWFNPAMVVNWGGRMPAFWD